jgi:hypothetical protein
VETAEQKLDAGGTGVAAGEERVVEHEYWH